MLVFNCNQLLIVLGTISALIEIPPAILGDCRSLVECVFQTKHLLSIRTMAFTLRTLWLMRSDTRMNNFTLQTISIGYSQCLHKWLIGWECCMMKMWDAATGRENVN